MAFTLETNTFPKNVWYVAALSKELKAGEPLARTLLNQNIVLYRDGDGKAHALEDRCCHRALPLSLGTVEKEGLRCGYHGLLFNGQGQCIEIPGQEKIPRKACVKAYTLEENNDLIWLWYSDEAEPTKPCPQYQIHSNPDYVYDSDKYHYQAPYQLMSYSHFWCMTNK